MIGRDNKPRPSLATGCCDSIHPATTTQQSTSPVVVIWSCDPSMRSQTQASICICTTLLHLDLFVSCIQHCWHVHSHWSGVFNLLKFNHISKKKHRDPPQPCNWYRYSSLNLCGRTGGQQQRFKSLSTVYVGGGLVTNEYRLILASW